MKRAGGFAGLLLAIACMAAPVLAATTIPPGVKVPAWDELSSQQQGELAAYADRWDRMAASRRVKILERYVRWKGMPPPEREALREGARNFREMSPALREKMRLSMSAVHELPVEQQRQLRRHWRSLTPQQRREWLERGGPGVSEPP